MNSKILFATGVFMLYCFNTVTANDSEITFQPIAGLYEPSGVVQLPDAQILVIEDEARQPFSLISHSKQTNNFSVAEVHHRTLRNFNFSIIDDLEGLALASTGIVYAISSHSRKSNGKRDKSREKLMSFTLKGDQVSSVRVRRDLRKSLLEKFPILKTAAKVREVKEGIGLGIEGISFDPEGEFLWIGFREPVIEGNAVLVALDNPEQALELGEEFEFTRPLLFLDLDRGGIRDIIYDANLNGYLIMSQREGTKKEKRFKLWFWEGKPEMRPRRVKITGLKRLERTEGISPVMLNGSPRLLLLSDDGNREKRRPANYLLIDYDSLEIEPPDIIRQSIDPDE